MWAFTKSVPRLASASMWGVFAWGCPPRHPTQSLRSSIAMKRILGLVPPVVSAVARAPTVAMVIVRRRAAGIIFIKFKAS